MTALSWSNSSSRENAAEVAEGGFEPLEEHSEGLPRVEVEPEQPGVAEDDQQDGALAPGQANIGKVDLGLETGWRLEAHDGLGLGPRPHPGDIIPELGDAASIAGGADLLEEANRRELGIDREPLVNNGGVGGELRRAPGARARRRRGEVPPSSCPVVSQW